MIAADAPEFERLLALLAGRFEISTSAEQRTISVAAPDEAEDLARAQVVKALRDARTAWRQLREQSRR